MMTEQMLQTTEYEAGLISVIVPVYRSEDTLKESVSSVLRQSEKHFELILLPNGGRAADEDLCQQLAGEDERIRVVRPDKAGASHARNEGIRSARGEYICFLDSDDKMMPRALSAMLDAIRRDGSDLVIAGFDHLYYGERVVKPVHREGCIDPRSDRNDLQRLYEEGFLNMPWNKLYKHSMIRNLFPEELSLGEDLCFNLDYINACTKVSLLPVSVCEYRQDDRGSTLSGKKRDDRVSVCLQLYARSKTFFSNIWELDKDEKGRLSFLGDKVVSTFLDELGMLGTVDMDKAEFERQIRLYTEAIRHFTKDGRRKVSLKYPDHRILYRPASHGKAKSVARLVRMRGSIVKLRRRTKKSNAQGEKE